MFHSIVSKLLYNELDQHILYRDFLDLGSFVKK